MLHSSLIVVKTPFSLLGDSLLLHIMTFKDVMWIIWHLLLVVVIFLIFILSCLNKPDSHVLQANEFSFKSAFIIFTESSSPKPPPSFPESALRCCFSFDFGLVLIIQSLFFFLFFLMEICFKNNLLEAYTGGFESRGLLAWQSGWVVQEVSSWHNWTEQLCVLMT